MHALPHAPPLDWCGGGGGDDDLRGEGGEKMRTACNFLLEALPKTLLDDKYIYIYTKTGNDPLLL